MVVTLTQEVDSRIDENRDVTVVTLSADADSTARWIQTLDGMSIEVDGIVSDQIQIFATNDPSKDPTTGGYLVDPAITLAGLFTTTSTTYRYISVRRVGGVDGVITVRISTQSL